jgi:hypothetical protein
MHQLSQERWTTVVTVKIVMAVWYYKHKYSSTTLRCLHLHRYLNQQGATLKSFSESSKYPIPHYQSATPEFQETRSSNIGGASHCKPPHINDIFPTAVQQYICTTYRSSPPHFGTGKKLKEQRGPNPKSRAGRTSCCFCSVKPTKLRHRFILEN